MCFDQGKTQGVDMRHAAELESKLRASVRESRFADCATEAGSQIGGDNRRPMSDEEIVAELFRYHPPTPHTLPKFAAVNQAAKNFAEIILQNCPPGPDRSAAIRKICEARMTSNKAIALNGLSL